MGSVIGELNVGLRSLLDALQSESMAAAKVRFCIIGFADDAVCYLEPSDLRKIETMPSLSARGATSFAAAFDALARRIPEDIKALKADDYEVNRPAVFFLTDGGPTDSDRWEGALQRLNELSARPNILAFGIGSAVASVIRQVASNEEYAYISATGGDTGQAITKFITALTQSIINSGHALAAGKASPQIEKPDNFISLAVDTV
ncbi:MAG TPA: hypothetical protein VF477_23400 [Mycobacterium sp.]